MAVDYKAIGVRVKACRKAMKMTQAQLAQKCEMSTSFVGHVERGTRVASLETLVSLALLFGCGLDELVFGHTIQPLPIHPILKQSHTLNLIMQLLSTNFSECSDPFGKGKENQMG